MSKEELILAGYGYSIGKNDESIVIKTERGGKMEKSFETVSAILIHNKGVSLSSDVISECVKRRISLFLIDNYGNITTPLCSDGWDGELSLLQLKAKDSEKGLFLAKMFVYGKVKNQFSLLKRYFKYPPNKSNSFGICFSSIKSELSGLIAKIKGLNDYETPQYFRQQLFGLEGSFASYYWDLLRLLLEDYADFKGRIKKNPADIINIALNYGYGILYGEIYQALLKAGLNPLIGFLHSFQKGKNALVYDLVEEFRACVIDRAVLTLLRRGQGITCDEDKLTTESRKKIANEVLKRLQSQHRYKNKKLTLGAIITQQALKIKKYLLEDTKYKPFLSSW